MTGVLAAAVRDQVEDLPGRIAFEATDDFAGFVKPCMTTSGTPAACRNSSGDWFGGNVTLRTGPRCAVRATSVRTRPAGDHHRPSRNPGRHRGGDPQEAVAAMAAYLSETGEDLGATI